MIPICYLHYLRKAYKMNFQSDYITLLSFNEHAKNSFSLFLYFRQEKFFLRN